MHLSYYLFNSSVKTFADAWQSQAPPGSPNGYTRIKLRRGFAEWAEAYLLKSKVSTPAWVNFVRPCCPAGALDGVHNVTNSIVLLLKVQSRIFAMCFGYGHTVIDPELLEADFGLWVTANSIAANKITSIQARNEDGSLLPLEAEHWIAGSLPLGIFIADARASSVTCETASFASLRHLTLDGVADFDPSMLPVKRLMNVTVRGGQG